MAYQASQQTIDMVNFATEGNIIDHSWYHIIKKKTPKSQRTDSNAIILLSDIVYWYKPIHKIDEDSGVHSIHKKFKADILQRSYHELENQFGFTKDQSRSAIETLESLGIIEREFRTVIINGIPVPNIMYLKFHEKVLKSLMKKYYQDPELFKKSLLSCEKNDDPIEKNHIPPTKKPTYTKNTTQNSTESDCIADAPSAEKDRIEIINHKKEKRTLLKQDLFFLREKFNHDWTEGEIAFLWERLCNYKGYINDLTSLCHAIVMKERSINFAKPKKEKKSKEQIIKNQGPLRSWDEFVKSQQEKK